MINIQILFSKRVTFCLIKLESSSFKIKAVRNDIYCIAHTAALQSEAFELKVQVKAMYTDDLYAWCLYLHTKPGTEKHCSDGDVTENKSHHEACLGASCFFTLHEPLVYLCNDAQMER